MNDKPLEKGYSESSGTTEKCPMCMMFRDFFGGTPLPMIIMVFFWSIIFIAGAIYCGVKFFRVVEVQQQIMYAAGFVCFVVGIALIKIFSWQMMNKNYITRKIKELEQRVMELTDAIRK